MGFEAQDKKFKTRNNFQMGFEAEDTFGKMEKLFSNGMFHITFYVCRP